MLEHPKDVSLKEEQEEVQCPKCGHKFIPQVLIEWPWRVIEEPFLKAVAQKTIPQTYGMYINDYDESRTLEDLDPNDIEVIHAQAESELFVWITAHGELPLFLIDMFRADLKKSKKFRQLEREYKKGDPTEWDKWLVIKSDVDRFPVGKELGVQENGAVNSLTYRAGPNVLEITVRITPDTTGTIVVQKGEVLTAPEAAEYLGYTLRHFYRIIDSGEIQVQGQVGRYRYFNKYYLDRWKEDHKRHTPNIGRMKRQKQQAKSTKKSRKRS